MTGSALLQRIVRLRTYLALVGMAGRAEALGGHQAPNRTGGVACVTLTMAFLDILMGACQDRHSVTRLTTRTYGVVVLMAGGTGSHVRADSKGNRLGMAGNALLIGMRRMKEIDWSAPGCVLWCGHSGRRLEPCG